jgi:hypothetical protein
VAVGVTGEDEEQVREPVDASDSVRVILSILGGDQAPLRAAHD